LKSARIAELAPNSLLQISCRNGAQGIGLPDIKLPLLEALNGWEVVKKVANRHSVCDVLEESTDGNPRPFENDGARNDLRAGTQHIRDLHGRRP
jgi:hypothetical protein